MVGRTGRGADQFMLRLPEGMREQIKAAAESSGRSMNAEIVARLEESFVAPPPHELGADGQVTLKMSDLMDFLAKKSVR